MSYTLTLDYSDSLALLSACSRRAKDRDHEVQRLRRKHAPPDLIATAVDRAARANDLFRRIERSHKRAFPGRPS